MQKNHLDSSTQPPKKSQNLSGRVSDKFTSDFCFLQTWHKYAQINLFISTNKNYVPLSCSVFHGHHQGQRDCSYLRADMDGWLPLPSESHCHTTVEYCRAPIPATNVLLLSIQQQCGMLHHTILTSNNVIRPSQCHYIPYNLILKPYHTIALRKPALPFTLCLFSNWIHFSTSPPHCPE